MKVLDESYSELRLKRPLDKGMALFMLIWGSGFIGMPILMLVLMLQQIGVVTLQCDRPEPALVACEHQQTGFLGLINQSTRRYSGVTGANLNTKEGTDDDGDPTYEHWVTINTAQGKQVLLEALIMVNGLQGNPETMGAIATEVSGFVQSDQPSLTVQQENGYDLGNSLFLGFMALFPIIGTALLYFTLQSEELIFDRERGVLQRNRKTLLGPRHSELPLREIEGLEIETKRGKSICYQLNLLPASLKAEPLMDSCDRQQASEIEQKVQQFLHPHQA